MAKKLQEATFFLSESAAAAITKRWDQDKVKSIRSSSRDIINMVVGITALMVVYQTIPVLIRSPPPLGFGGNALSIANVQIILILYLTWLYS